MTASFALTPEQLAMSINPAQGISFVNEAHIADASARLTMTQSRSGSQPDVELLPKQELPDPQRTGPSSELPQDEVQVQRDSETNDEIVIKYLDHSGNLILQVPSSEVLGLTRAISEDFEQQAKIRVEDEHETVGDGGKGHGH